MKILLLDDDKNILNVLEDYLSFSGHQAKSVTIGQEALEILRQEEFDLLITDIIMPEQEGMEIIHTLNTELPALRIIAMSGGGRHHNYNFLHYAKRMGAHATIQKPFHPQELLSLINSL